MRRIKKVKIVRKPDICIGDHFIYKDIKWICLDIIDGNYLAITAKVWQELPFDFGNHNNWKESSLRRMLNYKFLDKLNKEHLVMQTSDMIADNGDKSYGTCKDLVNLTGNINDYSACFCYGVAPVCLFSSKIPLKS